MQFQYDYMGGAIPMNTGFLVCPRCVDDLNYQRKMLVIPPDPPPLLNTRPEPYSIDETNFFSTMDGDQIVTMQGDNIITQFPNPTANANTSVLVLSANLDTAQTSLAAAYLDLFLGDPANGGTSILPIITGSALRTNVVSSLEMTGERVMTNSAYLTVTSASAGQSNVSHVGIYNAGAGGLLLASGPVGATYPTILQNTVVRFDQLGLRIQLSA